MKELKNILVGVDLANGDQLVSDSFTDATAAAIENGIWLAQQNGGHLLFFHALEIPDHARFASEGDDNVERSLISECETRLEMLVEHARTHGVESDYAVTSGKSWVDIIRCVLKQRQDLVIIGTRQRGTAASVLFGSTGMKLLRKCPCPVWIAKPREHQQINSILVADDLSPVSDSALEMGVSMAALYQSRLHVLHVLELGLGRREWDSYQIRKMARAEASKKLDDQLAKIDVGGLVEPPRFETMVDAADTAIIRRIEQHEIDLLVMGTVARGGITGVLMGNTAERLLPRIPCSVMAVKPHDFICPVTA